MQLLKPFLCAIMLFYESAAYLIPVVGLRHVLLNDPEVHSQHLLFTSTQLYGIKAVNLMHLLDNMPINSQSFRVQLHFPTY